MPEADAIQAPAAAVRGAMRWRRLGLVWNAHRRAPWATSHAMGPTPIVLRDGEIRVYLTCLDAQGRGRPAWVDVDARDPTRVLRECAAPVLEIGEPGSFDDNGVMVTCMVAAEPGRLFMYYAGFELCTQVRYRVFSGLALSDDGGASFRRASRAPVLDRGDDELLFRGGPFVRRVGPGYRMWYVGGSAWTDVAGKTLPVYDLRVADSADGIRWPTRGAVCLPLQHADEHGFGRPWVLPTADGGFELFYSIRRRSAAAYRLGHARSRDGLHWTRDDAAMQLPVSAHGFDSRAIMYSAVIDVAGRRFCFYNGNDFGIDGFAVAELER